MCLVCFKRLWIIYHPWMKENAVCEITVIKEYVKYWPYFRWIFLLFTFLLLRCTYCFRSGLFFSNFGSFPNFPSSYFSRILAIFLALRSELCRSTKIFGQWETTKLKSYHTVFYFYSPVSTAIVTLIPWPQNCKQQ